MPTLNQFLADTQGAKFRNEIGRWPVNFDAILQSLDDPAAQAAMLAASRRKRPALAGVVRGIEQRSDVAAYLAGTNSHATIRFRQAVGVAVRIAMESLRWKTSGRKGSLGRRVAVAAGTTAPGAYVNSPANPSRYFSKAEIYEERTTAPSAQFPTNATTPTPMEPSPTTPTAPGLAPEDQRRRSERLRAGLEQIARIGTPEEQAETLEYLMNALAETRRAEGRIL